MATIDVFTDLLKMCEETVQIWSRNGQLQNSIKSSQTAH